MPFMQNSVEIASQSNSPQHVAPQSGWHSLILPVWLFVIGHRPLAFLAGQTLLSLAPLADLLGYEHLANTAHRMNEPDGALPLEKWLADRTQS